MDSSRALWARFEKSGKLMDYLTFCEARRRQTPQNGGADAARGAECPPGEPGKPGGMPSDQSSL